MFRAQGAGELRGRDNVHLRAPAQEPCDERGADRGAKLHVELTVAPPLHRLALVHLAVRDNARRLGRKPEPKQPVSPFPGAEAAL